MTGVIENEQLRIQVNAKGAELISVYSRPHDLEYMWKGDPVFWGKHAPVLFPIIGALKNNIYFFNGKEYTLNRHGFAREKAFTLVDKSPESLAFSLSHDEQTQLHYPFLFEFLIRYLIKGNTLETHYRVTNKGEGPMFFSLGAHPAFAVPLVRGTDYDDYYLQFDQPETLDRWSVSAGGLIEKDSVPFLVQQDRIPLTKELFYKGALVFKQPVSKALAIRSHKTGRGLSMDLDGFPYLGIWAAEHADFVCLEPWCGIADSVDADQELVHKEGILRLEQGGVFERVLRIRLF
ncbi:MAG TPA: aldose 1-epimerase family protein [Flavitalea sp.]|nr:aldose 1-epimerase family protein [Flavitalea sp.]